jgi:hypothetical protein
MKKMKSFTVLMAATCAGCVPDAYALSYGVVPTVKADMPYWADSASNTDLAWVTRYDGLLKTGNPSAMYQVQCRDGDNDDNMTVVVRSLSNRIKLTATISRQTITSNKFINIFGYNWGTYFTPSGQTSAPANYVVLLTKDGAAVITGNAHNYRISFMCGNGMKKYYQIPISVKKAM